MEKILFIDDHLDGCASIIAGLREKYHVKTLETIIPDELDLDCDLYIVDIHLPFTTGDKLISYIRPRVKRRAAFILLTADDISTSIQNYYQDFVDEFLSKSDSIEEILKRVEIAFIKKKKEVSDIIYFQDIEICKRTCMVKAKDNWTSPKNPDNFLGHRRFKVL